MIFVFLSVCLRLLAQIFLWALLSVTQCWRHCSAGSRCCRSDWSSLGAPRPSTSPHTSMMKQPRLALPFSDTRHCLSHPTPHSGNTLGRGLLTLKPDSNLNLIENLFETHFSQLQHFYSRQRNIFVLYNITLSLQIVVKQLISRVFCFDEDEC